MNKYFQRQIKFSNIFWRKYIDKNNLHREEIVLWKKISYLTYLTFSRSSLKIPIQRPSNWFGILEIGLKRDPFSSKQRPLDFK